MWGMDDNTVYIAFAFLMAGIVGGSVFGYIFGLITAEWNAYRWSQRETMKIRRISKMDDPHQTDPEMRGVPAIHIHNPAPIQMPMPGMAAYNWMRVEDKPTGPIPAVTRLRTNQFIQPNTDPIQQLDPRFQKAGKQQQQ